MQKMKKFMVVHRDPKVSWDTVEENWSKLVAVEPATWIRTYFNADKKVRYCLWMAPDADTLKKIFSEFNITFESILKVEETVPDIWDRQYAERMEEEEREDAVVDF